MSNAANEVSTDSLYGPGAITSGELTADEKALLAATDVEVRDGDDLITSEVTEGEDDEDPNKVQLDTEVKEPEQEAPAALLPVAEQVTDELVLEGLKQRQEDFQGHAAKIAEAGIDPEVILAEFTKEGKFSEETYAVLEGAGYTKDQVDAIVADQQEQTQAYYKAVYVHAGGPEGFARLATFAKTNDPTAPAAFNAAMEAGDLVKCKEIIEGLKGKMKAKYGTSNKGLQGKPAPASKPVNSVKPYATSAEMVAAMSDPRYARDRAYTAEVEARVVAK